MSPILQIVYILAAATACQLLGWRLGIPSIMFLLLLGILSGPVFNLVTPDALLGPSLFPLVELAVAVILFEGGLSLKVTELGLVRGPVSRLISICALITWSLLTLAAYTVLHLEPAIAAILAAILVVSGPTVVIPLLRTIRAKNPIEPILRWEGILIDPIGVLLAVIVAEVISSGISLHSSLAAVSGMTISLAVGCLLGWLGAWVLKQTVGKHLVPDHFAVPLCFSILFVSVTFSNFVHEHSGLLTSTVMGMVVARDHSQWVQAIEDFIGNTQRMFIGILFMILAAKLDPEYVRHLDLRLLLFILSAIIIVRPTAVFLSTIGSSLDWREKCALASVAPRGIVSAALASSLGTALAANMNGTNIIVPYTFATIIGTVFLYSLFSPLIFRFLNLKVKASEGVLFIGASKIPLAIGKVIKAQGFKVAFVDTNALNIKKVRTANMIAYQGNALSETILEDIDFDGIGNLLAFTPNEEANALAAVEYRLTFGSAHTFQVGLSQTEHQKGGGRIFGPSTLTLEKFEELWEQGYRPHCRDVQAEEPQENPEDELILAQIEKNKLYLTSWDNLKRILKPEKEIIFSRVATQR